jgi:hypothetical protein
MQKTDNIQKGVISTIKEWAAPSLVAIVGMLVWRDITELRSDVKLLLYEQSANHVKIEMLEADVKDLKNEMEDLRSHEPHVPTEPRNDTFYVRNYAIKEDEQVKPILTKKQ